MRVIRTSTPSSSPGITYRFSLLCSTTWLSSAQSTPLSASSAPRVIFVRSGVFVWYIGAQSFSCPFARYSFCARGRRKMNSTATGPSQGGPLAPPRADRRARWASIPTNFRHSFSGLRCTSTTLHSQRPCFWIGWLCRSVTTNPCLLPCGIGGPSTVNRTIMPCLAPPCVG